MSSSSSLLRLWSTIPTASSLRFPTQQTFSHSLPGNQVDYPSTVWLQVDVIWILLYFAVLWLKIKRCFLLGRKAMTNLDSILKSRDVADKGPYNKSSEGEGEDGMIWENGIETCILSCKKWIASLCLMHGTGCLGLVHGDDLEGWCGVGSGRVVHVWELMYTCGGFVSMYAKTNTAL